MKSNLDVLRAIAVCLVLADHAILFLTRFGAQALTGPPSPMRLGRYGVLIFFVHTCYVLLLSLGRDRNISLFQQALQFYVRRVFRIYPLVWLVVIACVLFHIPSAPNLPYAQTGTLALSANLLLAQNLIHVPSTSGPLWSLPFEIQMYLVIPFLFWSMQLRRPWLGILIAYVTSVVVCLEGGRIRGGYLLDFVPCFLAGSVAYIWGRKAIPVLSCTLWPIVIFSTGLVFVGLPDLGPNGYKMASWAACMVLGLTLPLFRDVETNTITVPAKLIAKYSYGLYVVHIPTMWVVLKLLPYGNITVRIVIALAMSGVFAVLLYHAVEAPMIGLGRRLSSPPQ